MAGRSFLHEAALGSERQPHVLESSFLKWGEISFPWNSHPLVLVLEKHSRVLKSGTMFYFLLLLYLHLLPTCVQVHTPPLLFSLIWYPWFSCLFHSAPSPILFTTLVIVLWAHLWQRHWERSHWACCDWASVTGYLPRLDFLPVDPGKTRKWVPRPVPDWQTLETTWRSMGDGHGRDGVQKPFWLHWRPASSAGTSRMFLIGRRGLGF